MLSRYRTIPRVKMNKIIAIILYFALTCAQSATISFQDCGSTYDIVEVQIDGCDKTSCKLMIGGEVNVNFTIKTTAVSGDVLDASVVIKQMNINIPQTVTPQNMCHSSKIPCPIPDGTISNFAATIEVDEQHFPDEICEMKWSIYDDSGEEVICMITDIQLHD